MIVSVHQPQYLPWLGYFDKIERSDCFVFLDKVQYKHREYQNRNRIRTKEGWIWLTVPILSKGLKGQRICDVKIDQTLNWQEKHYRSFATWYANAPFFDSYTPFLEEIYLKQKWQRLLDLNVHITKYILKELAIDTPIRFESDIGTTKTATDRIIEICKKLGADVYLSGMGAKAYLEEEKLLKAKIKLQYQDFVHPKYNQCFMKDKDDFIPNMASVDLLFNEGQKSKEVLAKGA